MKKALFVCAMGLMTVVAFSSCEKKCECKTSVNGTVVTTTEIEVEKGKKCTDYEGDINIGGLIGASVDCRTKY